MYSGKSKGSDLVSVADEPGVVLPTVRPGVKENKQESQDLGSSSVSVTVYLCSFGVGNAVFDFWVLVYPKV